MSFVYGNDYRYMISFLNTNYSVYTGCPDFSSWMSCLYPPTTNPSCQAFRYNCYIQQPSQPPFLYRQPPTPTNPPAAILPLQTTTNTHQPSPSHPRLTDNHQHPPTLSFVKKRMDEGLVVVCTDNHQHPPTLPQPSFLYRQPPTPTNPFI